MEPNGIFLNRIFQAAAASKGKRNLEQRKEDLLIVNNSAIPSPQNFAIMTSRGDGMTRSSSSSSAVPFPPARRSQQQQQQQQELLTQSSTTTMMRNWEEDTENKKSISNNNNSSQMFQSGRHQQKFASNNSSVVDESHKSKNKRPIQISHKEVQRGCYEYCDDDREEDNNNNEDNNDNNYSIKTIANNMSSCTSSSVATTTDSPRATKKFKSKSGVRAATEAEYLNANKTFDDKTTEQLVRKEREEPGLFALPKTSSSSFTSPSPLTWKLPSFLCLPFTNNDANNSYFHLMNTSSKSTGILSLTSLVLVVFAVLLASVPAPVMSATATETGESSSSSIITDDISNNDVTPHDYLTTSSSILPVKLQTISFTSHEGTTPEDSALFSSAATGRTTSGGTGPSVTHQSVEGIRQEPSLHDFPGWSDNSPLAAHSGEMESSSDKGVREDSLLHKEYEFKSGYPELKNETREALEEAGSHQIPVFVGGSGYVPPNSLRTRPSLEADPLWQSRPLAESRYPVPLQSAWDRNYRNPFNMTRVQHIEAECQDDFMKIRVAMNGSFHGLIYSSGYSYDPDCVYVNGTGRDYYEYLIKLNRCGTLGASNHVEGRREPSKNFMWNTVTVQYNPMIEEEWDEHFKVTCEYGYDFWKTVTFPFLDVEVATGNPVVFTLTPPECYMEVRYGFGTAGTRVGGPVRVGDPLTLMINMRSQYDGFDIVVNDCYAHNGATKRIQLIDHYGCPVDSKLMSPFRGTWSHTNLYETQVYAYLKTFRFTGSPALYIECDVRMCHGQCPSQPCYWRNVKSVSKRSTDSQMITDSEKNSTLSENLSLFQALRVLQEDEDSEAVKSTLESNESVCMKTGAFTAMIALSTFILVVLTVSTMIMCFRIRRVKVIEERETAADILRPYSHHVSQQSQQQHQHPHQRHHHWASAKPR